MSKKFLPLLAFAILLTGVSCVRYRFGCALPQSQRDIVVLDIQNLTNEAALTTLLQDTLRERVMNTPGVKLVGEQDATLAITVKVVFLDQSRSASAKTRNSQSSHDDGDSYQTTLYRMSMRCLYTATPTREDAMPRQGVVDVTADIPLMQDLAIAQQAALKQLALDAAAKIVNAVCEE